MTQIEERPDEAAADVAQSAIGSWGTETSSKKPARFLPLLPLVFVLVLSAIYFLYLYVGHPARPGAQWPRGWFGWYDQGQYLKEAWAIRQGIADPLLYQYPFGYPFLGSWFLGILSYDPFLIPNLLMYAATIGFFYKTCESYLGIPFSLVGSLLLAMATPLTNLTVIPWTSTPVLLAMAFWTWVALTRSKLGYWIPAIGATLLALAYASRGGGEILVLVPLWLAVLWQFRREERLLLKGFLLFGIFAAGFALNLYWTERIFHSAVHPYYQNIISQGFSLSRVPHSLWGAIIYSGKEGEFSNPLLREGFWLALAPFGFGLYLARGERKPVHAGLLLSLIAGLIAAASFVAFDAGHLKYLALHYIKPWYPVAGFYALAAVRGLVGWKPAL